MEFLHKTFVYTYVYTYSERNGKLFEMVEMYIERNCFKCASKQTYGGVARALETTNTIVRTNTIGELALNVK